MLTVRMLKKSQVAPFAGAWIEIVSGYSNTNMTESLPSRERGLK